MPLHDLEGLRREARRLTTRQHELRVVRPARPTVALEAELVDEQVQARRSPWLQQPHLAHSAAPQRF